MPLKYNVKYSTDEPYGQGEVSGEFTNEEYVVLQEFLKYVDEAIDTDFIQKGRFGNLQIGWKRDQGMSFNVELPEWDDVIVFLHKLRPLILQSEPTSFHAIRNLLGIRHKDDPFIRDLLAYQKHVYSGKENQSIWKISSNDVVLNSEAFLDKYLNAYEFHRDKEYREFLEELHKHFPIDASKAILLQILTDKFKAILNLADLVTAFIKENTEVNAEFHVLGK